MNSQQIGLLVMQLLACCSVTSFVVVMLIKGREESHRYRLYALRDDLIFLVASGKISETSLLFRVFYSAITKSTAQVNNLTLYNLIRASICAKTTLQKEKQEKLQAAIEASSPETKAFVNKFAEVNMSIVMANSLTLRFTLFFARRCSQVINYLRRWITVPSYETYQTYRYFEGMHSLAHTKIPSRSLVHA